MSAMLTMLKVLNFFDQLLLLVVEIELITGRAHPIFDFIFIFAKIMLAVMAKELGRG